jgi:uncharacterized membrane protein YebE (DUF533 family)
MTVLNRAERFFSKKPAPAPQTAAAEQPPKDRWFANLLGKTSTLSEEEAFLAILMGAARADGVVSAEESDELAALTSRTRTLASLPAARISELRTRIEEKFRSQGLQVVLAEACQTILSSKQPHEVIRKRAESVFTHALDLVFTDREVNQKEQEYIEALAEQLQIDTALGKKIAEVIDIKNSF